MTQLKKLDEAIGLLKEILATMKGIEAKLDNKKEPVHLEEVFMVRSTDLKPIPHERPAQET